MKNRIISLILVLVISVLALASCGYSYAEDDLSLYTTYKGNDAVKEALKKLVIDDGDFTTDPEKRANKVVDSIYADLAASIKEDGEKLTEGVLSGHDILYYSYYVTATFDEKEAVLFAQNMKTDNAASVQLGLGAPSALETKLAELLVAQGLVKPAEGEATGDLKDKTYTSTTSGKYSEGDVVYVTYTVTYEKKVTDPETGEEGTTTATETYTNERITLTKDASPLVNHLLEKKASVGVSVDSLDDATSGKKYSGIKVNWIAKGNELGTVVDTTYTEKKEVTDVSGTKRDLNGVALTYHIYPVHYMAVPEYTAENLINEILGSSITIDSITAILFGRDFSEKEDSEKEELLKEYVTKKDDKDVSLEDFIADLAKLQKELTSADTKLDTANTSLKDKKQAYDDAVTAKEEAQKKYDEAKAAYDADTENEEKKKAFETADTALKSAATKVDTTKKAYMGEEKDNGEGGAVKTQKDAQEAYDKALTARNDKVTALLAIKEDMASKLTEGYKTATYDYLLEQYNEEIRMNLAAEVWEIIKTHVDTPKTPNEAVNETYKQLIENYEYEFYNGTYDSSKGISNYKQYNGKFKNYLVAAVKKDIDTNTKDYDDALIKVREEAQRLVAPILKIYVVAKAFDVLMTEEEFKEYKEDINNNYDANVYNYGESSVRHAFQFDKLMNECLLKYEEAEDGSYKYDLVEYTTR